MAQAQFPEPKDLEVDYVDRIGDSQPKVFSKWDVSNPHPGYGKDPNILNEYGHTVYPKMIYPNGPKLPGVVVNNQAEEDELLNPPSVPSVPSPDDDITPPASNGGWT